jgi:2-hydroxychromene-2-carboxylate isomerase
MGELVELLHYCLLFGLYLRHMRSLCEASHSCESAIEPAHNEPVGELIFLSQRLADRSLPSTQTARFFFALDCPFSYLAAERVERALGEVEWVPVLGPLSEDDGQLAPADRERRAAEQIRLAERDARSLHLPLVEPHVLPANSRSAARAATFAADEGVCHAFTLAVARLAFCGGYDIADDSVIAEAAAAAGLDAAATVAASHDQRYDARLDATSRGLRLRGIEAPPAISIGTSWFDGPDAIASALAFSAAHARRATPQAPAG